MEKLQAPVVQLVELYLLKDSMSHIQRIAGTSPITKAELVQHIEEMEVHYVRTGLELGGFEKMTSLMADFKKSLKPYLPYLTLDKNRRCIEDIQLRISEIEGRIHIAFKNDFKGMYRPV